jgi:soluble lytic murein transglycosylase-like protein
VPSGRAWASEIRQTVPHLQALARAAALAALLFIPCALQAVEAPGAQRDPALKAVVAKAINEAECFVDRNDSAVWYTLMEPRLRRIVQDQNERMEILRLVYCETQRPKELRLPPGLVMAMIDVESRFNRYAVSSAGAVGLMQVMPFWPEQLGMRRYELTHIAQNIRMGCAIFRHYLGVEHKDVRKALARYNGSIGRRDYPDLIVTRWTRWNGADDMGLPAAKSVPAAAHPVVKSGAG